MGEALATHAIRALTFCPLVAASLHIVHGIEQINRSGGGTSAFVAQLASTQAAVSGTRVTIITRQPDADAAAVDPQVQILGTPSGLGFGSALKTLHSREPVDVVHVHGLWRWSSHDLITTAQRLNLPTILSTHGMLQADALRTKQLKKKIAMLLYQRRDLTNADILHATAEHEAERLRQLGLRNPVVVAAPGVHPPPRTRLREWNNETERVALFFSRLHPIKNLLGLVRAWAVARPTGWRLVIAGPDANGHAAEVCTAINAAGLAGVVDLVGPRFDQEKETLFRSASLFILPSLSENFGIVVAESLAYGVPVITTTGTPWQSIISEGCGWYIEPNHAALVAAIDEATACSSATLAVMGLKGRQYVETHCQWSHSAAMLEAAYRQAGDRRFGVL